MEYRLVRTFGLTRKQDDFHLYRLATMVECDDFSPLLGEELFDLDRSSFKRTIYIAQDRRVMFSHQTASAQSLAIWRKIQMTSTTSSRRQRTLRT